MDIYTFIFQSIISFLVHAFWMTTISVEVVFRLKEEITWAFNLNFTRPLGLIA